jgi:hypothetical protein
MLTGRHILPRTLRYVLVAWDRDHVLEQHVAAGVAGTARDVAPREGLRQVLQGEERGRQWRPDERLHPSIELDGRRRRVATWIERQSGGGGGVCGGKQHKASTRGAGHHHLADATATRSMQCGENAQISSAARFCSAAACQKCRNSFCEFCCWLAEIPSLPGQPVGCWLGLMHAIWLHCSLSDLS